MIEDILNAVYFHYVTQWKVERARFNQRASAAIRSHWCWFVLLRDGRVSPSLLDRIEKSLRPLLRTV